jgi:hemoglobin/transferrin/lactoferrin receptor protein
MQKLWILILILTTYSYAQVITVKEENTLRPLERVTVYATDVNLGLVTDSRGKVDITSLKESNNLIFRLLGYEKIELSYDEIIRNNNTVIMKETALSLENVVVSTKRWEEERSDVPNNIEVITSKDVEMKHPQTAADMLNLSGKVFIQKSQLGGGSPMIRGFATNRVLIVIDNVRMNTAIFRSGNVQNVILIDANSIDNTQIIFGPGSVIYGSDAIGGVMEFNTLSPQFSYSKEILFNGNSFGRYSSSNNENTLHLDFNVGLERWAFLTSVTYSKFGDLIMGSDGPDDYLRPTYQDRINDIDSIIINSNPRNQIRTRYNQLNLMQKIRFKPFQNWEFNYGFYISESSDIPRYDRLIEFKNSQPVSAEWYYGPQKWMMHRFTVSNYSSNTLYDLSKLIFAYQNFEESRNDRKFNKINLRHRTENVDAISMNLDFVKKISEQSRIYYGVETVFNRVGSIGESENILNNENEEISNRYPDGSIWNSYGTYLTYKQKINSRYVFQSGIRYNLVYLHADFDRTFYPLPFKSASLTTGAFTGNAGLAWHPESDLQVNLNFSTGFRAPNIDDMGKVFDSEPGSVVVPNPNLKAEYIFNAEIGLIKSVKNILKAELVAFYSHLDNALVRRDFLLNGQDSIYYDGTLSKIQAIQNAAYAYIWGVQIGVDYHFAPNFSFLTRFNYQFGKEEDELGNLEPLRHAAPWFGNSQISFKRNNIDLVLYIFYNGKIKFEDLAPSERNKTSIYAKDENGNPYSPFWYTLNIKFGYQILEYLKINLGIENITDQRYRPYSSGITAPGLNFISSVKFSF